MLEVAVDFGLGAQVRRHRLLEEGAHFVAELELLGRVRKVHLVGHPPRQSLGGASRLAPLGSPIRAHHTAAVGNTRRHFCWGRLTRPPTKTSINSIIGRWHATCSYRSHMS